MKPNVKMKLLLASVLSLFIMACDTSPKEGDSEATDQEEVKTDTTTEAVDQKTEGVVYEKEGLKVYQADIAKEFPDAELKLESPTNEKVTKKGNYEFKFNVSNYELATQTPMADMRNCANSEKGQHIHFILNNGPYEAHYEPNFKADLMEGNNVVLAFLSRSYHESIKNGKAYILNNYAIGNPAEKFDPAAQHLFYSRPKGTYSGKDTSKILLDFYLVNTALSKDGNQVKVSIDGHEFMLSDWQPYFVEGLSTGEHNFRIQLVDNAGNLIPGPFNDSGERKITLEK